jgi:hypothetical protein
MEALERHALGEIQTWRNSDEEIAQELAVSLTTANPVPSDLPAKIYAAHMVAAATTAAFAEGGNIPAIFGRMLDLLKAKNDANPTFGPLLVRHPGNIRRDRVYIPFSRSRNAATEVAPFTRLDARRRQKRSVGGSRG